MQLRGIIRDVLHLSAHLHFKSHYVAYIDSSRRYVNFHTRLEKLELDSTGIGLKRVNAVSTLESFRTHSEAFSPCFLRFYDLSRGASVHGMGPVLQYQAVPDDAWTRGAEQSQLEGAVEGTVQQRRH